MSLYIRGFVTGLFVVSVITTAGAVVPSSSKPRQLAPADRPDPLYVGSIIDQTRPAYVPSFAKPQPVVALQKEKDRAIRLEPRPGLILPWGYVESFYIPWYPGCP
jgi:hypothetical protein